MRLYNSPARPAVFTAVVVIVMDAGILRVKSAQLLRSFLEKKCRFTEVCSTLFSEETVK